MTTPRYVVPGGLYFITRSCTQRQFLLKPDEETNQIFEFSLALAASHTKVEILGFEAMSNHYHAAIHDVEGRFPEFLQRHHKLTAHMLNAKWGRSENVWSTEETCVTLLASEEDLVEKLGYILGNAARANLVESVAQWPGASSWRFLDGRSRTIERPESDYLKKKGSAVLEEVELSIAQPPTSKAKESFAAWAERVRAKVREVEAKAAKKRREDKVGIAGRKAVLAAKHTDTPKNAREKSKVRPRLAAMHEPTRIAWLMLFKEFWMHHDDACAELLAGVPNPVFPIGTYRARRLAKVRIGKRKAIDPEILRRHITRIPTG